MRKNGGDERGYEVTRFEGLRRALVVALRAVVGAFFAYVGFMKLVTPTEYFEIAIRSYRLFPESSVAAAARLIPWAELFLGAFLVVGYRLRTVTGVMLALALGLQLVFAQAVLRGLPIERCAFFCAGFIRLTLFQEFALDTVLLLLLVFIGSTGNRRPAPDRAV